LSLTGRVSAYQPCGDLARPPFLSFSRLFPIGDFIPTFFFFFFFFLSPVLAEFWGKRLTAPF